MSDEKTRADALGIYLTGASSNGGVQKDPALSLGNFRSSSEVDGMGIIVSSGIPALVLKNATPSNGEGTGTITIDANGDLIYTAPNDTAGLPVSIADGETKFLESSDFCKGVRVFRSANFPFSGVMSLDFVEPFNGVLGMEDIPNSDRVAGESYYRAFMIYAHGTGSAARIRNLVITQGGAGPRQSILTFGKETPVLGSIQTIPDEKTAPAAISFVESLDVGTVLVGSLMGIWIKKTFPILGAGSPREKVSVKFSFATETT